nr:putative ankyrin repeat protein [Megavirus caiporensis]
MSEPYFMLPFERQPHANKVHARSTGPTPVIERIEKENSDNKIKSDPKKLIKYFESNGFSVYLDNNNKIKIEL